MLLSVNSFSLMCTHYFAVREFVIYYYTSREPRKI